MIDPILENREGKGTLDQVRSWMWVQYLNEVFFGRARFRVCNPASFQLGEVVSVLPVTGSHIRGQFTVHAIFVGSRWRRPYIETWSRVPEGMRQFDMLAVAR